MSISQLKGKNISIPLWAPVTEVESVALDQLRNVAALPWIAHMAVMPDVHFGSGATVGSVIAMRKAVSPAAVGVDIGCGMGAIRTNLDPDKVLKRGTKIFDAISSSVPVGPNAHESSVLNDLPLALKNEVNPLREEFKTLAPEAQSIEKTAILQLGTLGGGNHFIEINLDEEDNVWVMLHSGSRRVGKELAEIHINKAMKLEHNVGLPDKALAAFLADTPEMAAYRRDLFWAQRYAAVNRKIMMFLVTSALRDMWPSLETSDEVWCHHNYVAEEFHFGEDLIVTRKGAIRAQAGDLGIIPGAMGTRSYIVRGKGNAEALNSAPHGAGRKMSRGAAKKKFTIEDLAEATKNTICRKDAGVLDEISGAYKKIDKVIEYSSDLVDVVAVLQPAMVCVKG